jgi:hypothetical protein
MKLGMTIYLRPSRIGLGETTTLSNDCVNRPHIEINNAPNMY